MKRRDALVGLAMVGASAAAPSCARPGPNVDAGEEQLRVILGQLAGLELGPGEGPRVIAALRANRFAGQPDPTTQPQSDFDPEIE